MTLDQGEFCFLAAAVIPPDACADVTAGITSLEILDHVGGRMLFKVSAMTNKPEIGDEKEPTDTFRHALTEDTPQGHIGGNASDQTIPTLLDALCQPGQSSDNVPQAHRQEGMSVSGSSSGREENAFRFLMRVCALSGGDGVPHVDPHN